MLSRAHRDSIVTHSPSFGSRVDIVGSLFSKLHMDVSTGQTSDAGQRSCVGVYTFGRVLCNAACVQSDTARYATMQSNQPECDENMRHGQAIEPSPVCDSTTSPPQVSRKHSLNERESTVLTTSICNSNISDPEVAAIRDRVVPKNR